MAGLGRTERVMLGWVSGVHPENRAAISDSESMAQMPDVSCKPTHCGYIS